MLLGPSAAFLTERTLARGVWLPHNGSRGSGVAQGLGRGGGGGTSGGTYLPRALSSLGSSPRGRSRRLLASCPLQRQRRCRVRGGCCGGGPAPSEGQRRVSGSPGASGGDLGGKFSRGASWSAGGGHLSPRCNSWGLNSPGPTGNELAYWSGREV